MAENGKQNIAMVTCTAPVNIAVIKYCKCVTLCPNLSKFSNNNIQLLLLCCKMIIIFVLRKGSVSCNLPSSCHFQVCNRLYTPWQKTSKLFVKCNVTVVTVGLKC